MSLEIIRAGTRRLFEVNGLVDAVTGDALSPPPTNVKAYVTDGEGNTVINGLDMDVDPDDPTHYTLVYQLDDDSYPGVWEWWVDVILVGGGKDRTLKMTAFQVQAYTALT